MALAARYYDSAGNRTLLRHGEMDAEDLTYYEYNEANELLSAHDVSGWTYFSYDANGNTVQQQTPAYTRYYDWDGRDMMVGVRSTEAGWTDNVYRYDGFASRVCTLESIGLTYYDWDSINVIQEKDATNAVTDRQVHGYAPIPSVDDITVLQKSGTPYVPQGDPIGTEWYLLDSSAAIANSYTYDAFGVSMGVTESTPNGYRFGGKRLDPDSHFYHFIARQYNPAASRFLASDTGSETRAYIYCWARPLKFVDPTGHETASLPAQPQWSWTPIKKTIVPLGPCDAERVGETHADQFLSSQPLPHQYMWVPEPFNGPDDIVRHIVVFLDAWSWVPFVNRVQLASQRLRALCTGYKEKRQWYRWVYNRMTWTWTCRMECKGGHIVYAWEPTVTYDQYYTSWMKTGKTREEVGTDVADDILEIVKEVAKTHE